MDWLGVLELGLTALGVAALGCWVYRMDTRRSR
jgi:hypothetical protein